MRMAMNTPSSETSSTSAYIRLHITPLNPTLLSSILPPQVLPSARNISYHTLQTFPERDFGFVDLPIMEAQKIKKKLNGAILKGTKVRIEDARPSKEMSRGENTSAQSLVTEVVGVKKPSKKRRRDTETLSAVELQGRAVKRGWTDPKAPKRSEKRTKGMKDVVKSKYTSGPECLFQTTLPANVAASMKDGLPGSGPKTERRQKKKLVKNVLIHEFSRTTKHATFLRSSGIPSTATGVSGFVDGKGWIDRAGNVIEKATSKLRNSSAAVVESTQSSSDAFESSELEDVSEDDTSDGEVIPEAVKEKKVKSNDSSTSSSGISSDEEVSFGLKSESSSDSEAGESSEAAADSNGSRIKRVPKAPNGLTINIPKPQSESKNALAIHPLEALFKKRQADSEEVKTTQENPSFSFFDGDAVEHTDDEGFDAPVPMTPFTKQEFALRGERSAAPTPDTAFPGKPYTIWPTENGMNGQHAGRDRDSSPTQKPRKGKDGPHAESPAAPISDFQKWFYEHRGETNRAWKKRKKVVAKEKRQKENRKRIDRSV